MACKLKATPDDPQCEITGPAGSVQLKVVGTFGSIVFTAAEYNGQELVSTPVDTITVPIVAGKKNLFTVYGFSAGASGRGELREVCDATNVLDDNIRGDNQSKIYRICAPGGEVPAPSTLAAEASTPSKP